MGIPRQKRYRWRRRIMIVLLVPTVVLACVSRPWVGDNSVAALAMYLVGWGAFVGGAFFRLWATLYIGGRKSEMVVTDGPYSLCRNPLYVGTFLIGFALGLFLHSFTVVAVVVLGMVVYATGTIPSEERYLAEQFGEPYRAYLARTPRYFPALGRYHAPEFVEVSIQALRKELTGACGWVLLPVLGELLVRARTLPGWPNVLSFALP